MWRERLASALPPAGQALAAWLLSCAVPVLAAGAPPAVTQVESIAMTVSDMDGAVDFYTRVLTFEKVTDRGYPVRATSISGAFSACACAPGGCPWARGRLNCCSFGRPGAPRLR